MIINVTVIVIVIVIILLKNHGRNETYIILYTPITFHYRSTAGTDDIPASVNEAYELSKVSAEVTYE